jgi:hypothetical protein
MATGGLTKLVDVGSYWEDCDTPVSLINVENPHSGLQKVAADSAIEAFVKDSLTINPDMMYLHINAMGAGEYYGSNKNGDYFPEENLIRYHKSFETSGYIYRHHINKDPAKSLGKVIFSTYNPRMHRVELIAEVSKLLGKDIEEGIAINNYPLTSMGCKTPYDVCSICGNKAHNKDQYCKHVTAGVNRMMGDGSKVMLINEAPLTFFDLSIVLRPADITSSVLVKVASTSSDLSVNCAADWALPGERPLHKSAETIKQAALKKVSTLIKNVDVDVAGDAAAMKAIIAGITDPSMDLIPTLSQFPLSETLNAFAEIGAAPSVRFLAELFAYKLLGSSAKGIGDKAEMVTLMLPASMVDMEEVFKVLDMEPIEEGPGNKIIVDLLRKNSDASLFPAEVEKRAYYGGPMMFTDASNMPRYITMMPEDVAAKRQEILQESQENPGFFKALLVLGGAAIIGRSYVSSLIDEKVEKAKKDLLVSQYAQQQAKIDFVKTASFASAMIDSISVGYYHLSKAKNTF